MKTFLEYAVRIIFVLSSSFVLLLGLLFITNPSLFQKNNIQIITPQVVIVGSKFEDIEFCDDITDFDEREECIEEKQEEEEQLEENEYAKANAKEVACVRQALWYEARGEGIDGIKAVASVIVNRVQSGRYPDSFCEVIHQPMQFSYVHEFKAKGKPLIVKPKPVEVELFHQVNDLAHKIVLGKFQPVLQPNVMWYAHQRINNYWTKKKKVVAQIGRHVFYTI